METCPTCRGTGVEIVRPYNMKLPCGSCQYPEDDAELCEVCDSPYHLTETHDAHV